MFTLPKNFRKCNKSSWPQSFKRSFEINGACCCFYACQLCYQAFFFDNSENDKPFIMFAHFKKISSEKKWDTLKERDIPNWFRVYYSQKVLKLK
jgi:hypothetical protein